jgi:hypothetical protein
MNIYEKLIEVRKIVPYLQKENSGTQYNYVSSSQVLASCINKMNEIGLLLIPNVLSHNVNESPIETLNDKQQIIKRTITYFTELDIEYIWVNAEKPDETIKCKWYGQGVDIAGEKGVGKALTYAEKYFLLKSFNIATDKDDPDSFQGKNDENPKEDKPKEQQKTITDAQIKRAYAIAKESNLGEDAIKVWIKGKYNKESLKTLTVKEYEALVEAISRAKEPKA